MVTLFLVDLNLPPWYQSLCKLAIGLEDMHMDLEDLQLDIQLALENWLYPRLEGMDLDRYIIVYIEYDLIKLGLRLDH